MSIPKQRPKFWDKDDPLVAVPVGPVEEVEVQTLYVTNIQGHQASIQVEPGDTLQVDETEINGSIHREDVHTTFRFYTDKLIAWKIVTQKVTRPVRR